RSCPPSWTRLPAHSVRPEIMRGLTREAGSMFVVQRSMFDVPGSCRRANPLPTFQERVGRYQRPIAEFKFKAVRRNFTKPNTVSKRKCPEGHRVANKTTIKIDMRIIVGKNLAAPSSLERTGKVLTVAGILFGAICAHAVTFLSEPSFSPASNAPLAGVLQV